MKLYIEVLRGNSLGVIDGEEMYDITYGEPMTLGEIIEQDMPDFSNNIYKCLLERRKHLHKKADESSMKLSPEHYAHFQADAIINLLEGGE